MNEQQIKETFTGKVNFNEEQNVDYVSVDLTTNLLTHHFCYLAPDGEVYTNKSEYDKKNA